MAGNARARRFYEREGWRDEGHVDYAAEGPDGPIVVSTRLYRMVRSPARRSPRTFDLEPHPEGGWYRQTWASPVRSRCPTAGCGRPRR